MSVELITRICEHVIAYKIINIIITVRRKLETSCSAGNAENAGAENAEKKSRKYAGKCKQFYVGYL